MKRILLGLVMLGGLALMAAPPAGATAVSYPLLCAKPAATTTNNYAILLTGGDPSTVSADPIANGPNLPGAVTNAYGVGTIQFGAAASPTATSCAVTGELIYDGGDLQTNPIGLFFGPQSCYAGNSLFGAGVPCFDGKNHFSNTGTITTGGPDGSYFLSFNAGYNWSSNAEVTGAEPFSFWVQPAIGNAVGTSIPGTVNTAVAGNGAPVLTLLLQPQKPAVQTKGTPGYGVANVFGSAPYVGAAATSCSAYGANTTDFISASNSAAKAPFGATVAGGLESIVGSVAYFNACQGSGSLSFNANDNYVITPSTGSAGEAQSNTDCGFQYVPGECAAASQYAVGYANTGGVTTSEFLDGGNNGIAFFNSGLATCDTLATLPGVGFSTSGVQWGSANQNTYIIVTSYYVPADAGFIGGVSGEALCTQYEQASTAGTVATAVAQPAASATITASGPLTTGLVKVTNPTEADCDLTSTMASTTKSAYFAKAVKVGTVTTNEAWETTCSLDLAGGSPVNADNNGPSLVAETAATIDCQCSCTDVAPEATCTAAGKPFPCCTGLGTGTGAACTTVYAGSCDEDSASVSITKTLTLMSNACELGGRDRGEQCLHRSWRAICLLHRQ